jgi:RNA polymerase sigma-70 factor (ECF subfamily)
MPMLQLDATAPASLAKSRRTDLERLFGEHNSSLLRYISAKVGSPQEAQEIAQEAYVHLLQLDHPEAISYLRAFLFKTAHNLAVDRIRERGRRETVSTSDISELLVFELSPERQVAGEQEMAVFLAAVNQLPAKCRRAFILHRIHNLHVDEIAERMNIGACMVRRYISRALDYIRYTLDAASLNNAVEP